MNHQDQAEVACHRLPGRRGGPAADGHRRSKHGSDQRNEQPEPEYLSLHD
jgi:hypothetical protein